MSATVKIRLADLGPSATSQSSSFAVADLTPIQVANSRESASRRHHNIVVDLRTGEQARQQINVEPGNYSVRIKFSSGEVLTQTVSVSADKRLEFQVERLSRPAAKVKNVEKKAFRYEERRMVSPQTGVQRIPYKADSALALSLRSAARTPGHAMTFFVQEPVPAEYGIRKTVQKSRVVKTVESPRNNTWAQQSLSPGLGISSLTKKLKAIQGTAAPSGRAPVIGRVRTKVASAEVEKLLTCKAAPKDIVECMLGVPLALQPTKVKHGRAHDSAHWLYPLTRLPREEEGQTFRYFALLDNSYRGMRSTTLACLPGPWVVHEQHTKARISFHVPVASGDGTTTSPRIEIHDDKIADVLAFLESGDASAAYAIIEPSLGYLFEKKMNPYAATAGGYVLLYNKFDDPTVPWQQWIANSAAWFTAIPDGMILYATLLLQTPTGITSNDGWAGIYPQDNAARRRMAFHAVLEAVRRGPPLYKIGLSLLASNIKILSNLLKEEEDQAQLKSAEGAIRYLRLRTDPNQAFCVFSIPNEGTT